MGKRTQLWQGTLVFLVVMLIMGSLMFVMANEGRNKGGWNLASSSNVTASGSNVFKPAARIGEQIGIDIDKVEITDEGGRDLAGTELDPTEVIKIWYSFKIPETAKGGDFAYLSVPRQIEALWGDKGLDDWSVEIYAPDPEPGSNQEYHILTATYQMSESRIFLQFTDFVTGYGEEIPVKLYFWAEFDLEEIKTGGDEEETLLFTGGGDKDVTITVTFKGKELAFRKEALAAEWNETENGYVITWEIFVNEENARLKDIRVTDELAAGLVYMSDDILPDKAGWERDIQGSKLVWKYTGETDKAFKISVKTKVEDLNVFYNPEQDTAVITNKAVIEAEINGERITQADDAEVVISGNWISKKGEYNSDSQTITWTIVVNQDGAELINPRLEDTLDRYLEFEKLVVYRWPTGGNEELLENNQQYIYNYNEENRKITVQWINPATITERYVIECTTKVKPEYFNQNHWIIENTAWLYHDGNHSGSSSTGKVSVESHLINKGIKHINAEKLTVDWEIDINKNRNSYPDESIKIVDILNGQSNISPELQVLLPETIQVYELKLEGEEAVPDTEHPWTEGSGNHYTINTDGLSEKWEIEFKRGALDNTAVRISFTTQLDRDWIIQNKLMMDTVYFDNYVQLWIAGEQEGTGSAKGHITPEVIQKTYTTYNHDTKSIFWKIRINPNKLPLGGVALTDVMDERLALWSETEDEHGPLYALIEHKEGYHIRNEYRTLELVEPSAAEGYYFTADGSLRILLPEFGDLDKTIYIFIWTQITDEALDSEEFQKNGIVKLKNKAVLSFDDYPAEYDVSSEEECPVEISVIKKTGDYTSGNNYIDWTVAINGNALDWDMDKIVLTDELEVGLRLEVDSVKLTRYNIDKDGKPIEENKMEVELGDGDIVYDEISRIFKFRFSKGESGYFYKLTFRTIATLEKDYSNTITLSGLAAGDETWETIVTGVKFGAGGSATINEQQTAIIVKKTNEEKNTALSGARFTLWEKNKPEEKTTLDTNESGEAIFTGLKYNTTYYLQEVAPPAGYEISNEIFEIVTTKAVGEKPHAYEHVVTNKQIVELGEILIKKVDANNKPLAGARFQLESAGRSILLTGETGKDGNAPGELRFKGIPLGSYTIRELESPFGYIMDDSPIVRTVTITQASQQEVITITNQKAKGQIEIIKKDDSGNYLAGAVFELRRKAEGIDNEALFRTAYLSEPTKSDGKVIFEDVDYGLYDLFEVITPTGYVAVGKDKALIENIRVDGTNDQIVLPAIINDRIAAEVNVIKVSASSSSTHLKGAKFQLYAGVTDEQGKVTAGELLGEYETDDNGRIHFPALAYGAYVLVETQAPGGYQLPKNPVTTFTVLEEHHHQTIDIVIANQRRSTGGGGGGNETSTTAAPQPSTEVPTAPEESSLVPLTTTTRDGGDDEYTETELPLGYAYEYDEESGQFMVIDPNGVPLGWFDSMEDVLLAIPKTGDESLVVLFAILIIGAGGVIFTLLSKKRYGRK